MRCTYSVCVGHWDRCFRVVGCSLVVGVGVTAVRSGNILPVFDLQVLQFVCFASHFLRASPRVEVFLHRYDLHPLHFCLFYCLFLSPSIEGDAPRIFSSAGAGDVRTWGDVRSGLEDIHGTSFTRPGPALTRCTYSVCVGRWEECRSRRRSKPRRMIEQFASFSLQVLQLFCFASHLFI